MKNFYKRLGIQFFSASRISEIKKRLAEIQTEAEKPDADLAALEAEADSLIDERKKLNDAAEQRSNLLNKLAGGQVGIVTRRFATLEQQEEQNYTVNSEEYRSAWLKNLYCSNTQYTPNFTEQEKRAFTTVADSAGAAIPTQVSNTIIEKVNQLAPLLSEINLLKVPGSVTVPVEDEVADAKAHTENSTINADNDTLDKITLFGYEITKLVSISKSVALMTISAFETWLTNSIAKKIAKQISNVILYGSGTNEGKGIDTGITWTNDKNAIEVGAAASLSTENVLALIALLPGGYDANAKFIMSKKTLFTAFMPLQDKSKNDIVKNEGKNYYIYGYPVLLDERVKLNEAYLGDFYTIMGNMPEDINITSDFDVKSNSYDFLGCCMFDCKPSVAEAFVKLKKAAGG